MTALYGGIDLHSNNSVVVKDAEGKVLYRQRLENDLRRIERALAPYRKGLSGVVVESTFNWYWLADGLLEAGYPVQLANTTAIQQYSGLKYTNDESDAEWLAEMLRLGILPTGYIYPKAERAVRDLLRQRTANILSIQNLVQRNTGGRMKSDVIKTLDPAQLEHLFDNSDVALAIATTVRVPQCLDTESAALEKAIAERRALALRLVIGYATLDSPFRQEEDREGLPAILHRWKVGHPDHPG